jgi:hypothetical protein
VLVTAGPGTIIDALIANQLLEQLDDRHRRGGYDPVDVTPLMVAKKVPSLACRFHTIEKALGKPSSKVLVAGRTDASQRFRAAANASTGVNGTKAIVDAAIKTAATADSTLSSVCLDAQDSAEVPDLTARWTVVVLAD